METIKLNDTEYIKNEKYLELQKELLDIKEKLNQLNNKQFKRMDYGIVDIYNVMAIIPFGKEENLDSDILKVEGLAEFKKFDEKVKLELGEGFKPEVFLLSNSRYGYEFLQRAIKTAKAFGLSDIPEFYLKFEKENYVQDFPCLIKIRNMVFILAPRVESQ